MPRKKDTRVRKPGREGDILAAGQYRRPIREPHRHWMSTAIVCLSHCRPPAHLIRALTARERLARAWRLPFPDGRGSVSCHSKVLTGCRCEGLRYCTSLRDSLDSGARPRCLAGEGHEPAEVRRALMRDSMPS